VFFNINIYTVSHNEFVWYNIHSERNPVCVSINQQKRKRGEMTDNKKNLPYQQFHENTTDANILKDVGLQS
jgi:hypothetical protein